MGSPVGLGPSSASAGLDSSSSASGSGSSNGSNQNTLSNLISAEGKQMESIMQAASTAIGAMGDSAKTGASAQ